MDGQIKNLLNSYLSQSQMAKGQLMSPDSKDLELVSAQLYVNLWASYQQYLSDNFGPLTNWFLKTIYINPFIEIGYIINCIL
jgi:hypothetical protein